MLKKEDVYINLKGKSKEELTELWGFLESIGEKQFRETLNDFLDNCNKWIAYEFTDDFWELSNNEKSLNEKTEVTIQQLKEILQPMELSLQQQLEKAKAEVERLKAEINKINIGDWCIRTDDCIFKVSGNDLNWARNHARKITDQELINKLNELIK